jgi:hypothetical protein
MQSKRVSRPGETRVWFAVLDAGEEVKKQILALVQQEKIAAASFVALGAFEKATIAYFDWEKKKTSRSRSTPKSKSSLWWAMWCRMKRTSPACTPTLSWASPTAPRAAAT